MEINETLDFISDLDRPHLVEVMVTDKHGNVTYTFIDEGDAQRIVDYLTSYFKIGA